MKAFFEYLPLVALLSPVAVVAAMNVALRLMGEKATLLLPGMCGYIGAAQAQDIEPRNYSNAPTGVNFLVAGAIHTRGGLEFDPSLPAESEHLQVTSGVLAYARTFGFADHSGKWDVVIPYGALSGSVDF